MQCCHIPLALLILLLHHCQFVQLLQTLIVPRESPAESSVVDLQNATGALLSIFPGPFADYFRLKQHKIVLAKSLRALPVRRLPLGVLLSYPPKNLNLSSYLRRTINSYNYHDYNEDNQQNREKLLQFEVHVLGKHEFVHFPRRVYVGKLATNAPAHSTIPGLDHISVEKLQPNKQQLIHQQRLENLRYHLLSNGDDKGLFILRTFKVDEYPLYAQILTKRELTPADVGLHRLRLTAQAEPKGNSDETELVVNVQDPNSISHVLSAPSPRFARSRYIVHLQSNLLVGSTVLRVHAQPKPNHFTISSAPGSPILFDIDPLSGDLFSIAPLTPGKHTYWVNAFLSYDGSSSGSKPVPVLIFVKPPSKNPVCTGNLCDPKMEEPDTDNRTRRVKRELRSTLVISIPEDTLNGTLPHRVPLGPNEIVKNAPVDSQYITVYKNGSMELVKQLNYELERELRFSVVVENTKTFAVSGQVVLLNVTDVDERPRFINEPVPFQAVVPTEVPIGYTVYKFQARDEEGDGDRDVRYILINSQPAGMFTIDETGRVKTARNQYNDGETYSVYVQAIDMTPESSDEEKRKSEVAVLSVMGGRRPPQFLLQEYVVDVPENYPVDASVVHIQAQSFVNSPTTPLRYKLYSPPGRQTPAMTPTFAIDASTGIVKLMQPLDADDPTQPRSYNLNVEAVEGSLTSSVKLTIKVKDENDNYPQFSQPLYTKTIPEDFEVGLPILTISAKDKDEGLNAQLVYAVDNRNFSINDRGEISAARRLDADQLKQGFFIYKFNVTARDRGSPIRSGSAQIQIRTENVNDESPRFNMTMFTEYVAEDARGETPILTIEAVDPDRDQVKYMFLSGTGRITNQESYFEIDEDTGLIKLKAGVGEKDLPKRNMFNLTVLAMDDGSCCQPGSPRHTSTATVIIGVKDVNNNKPRFPDCEGYSMLAKVPEGKHRDRSILKVTATDDDSGHNGEIVYSLYYAKGENRKPFTINAATGEIMASPYVEFDREERPFEEITVKATDKGERPLIGFCHFTVTVLDENDNAPEFERAEYETTISRHTPIGKSVLTIFADDRDAPQNARIQYSLREDDDADHRNDVRYVSIKDSGDIVLINSIYTQTTSLKFLVIANDSGAPPRETAVRVTLNIAEAPQQYPVWQETPDCPEEKFITEDVQLNSIIAKCLALPGNGLMNGRIQYSLSNGAKPDTNANGDFRIFHEKEGPKDYAIVRNLKNLDFEKVKKYSLTLTAQDLRNGLSREKKLTINLVDKNDNVPKFGVDKFTAFVLEEQEPLPFQGKPLAKVVATDADFEPAYRTIKYKILEGPASSLFTINEHTGEIWATSKFDREKIDLFILDVEAADSAPSDLPGSSGPNKDLTKVQIQIHDVNDNDPYFNETLYRGRIKENAEVGTSVLTVKAHDKDKDSEIRYSLDPEGNGGSAFGVRASSGTVYVNEPLDYETRKVYNLKVWANDGRHRASTSVEIRVEDVNDNAPEFAQTKYFKEIVEENYDRQSLPHQILKVSATDRDDDSSSQRIVYKLEGQGANDEFTIHERTGEIFVRKPLNRDPPDGVEKWNFIVQAVDDDGRGLSGYADVQVSLKDINDETPTFVGGPFKGFIDENQEPGASGVYIMTMTAVDNDDPKTDNAKITYEIQRNKYLDGMPLFRIEPHTGKIFAMKRLDRENPSQKMFDITVKATDHGQPPLQGVGTATILVRDRNDNEPYFDPPSYVASVKETAVVGYPVLTVSAKDEDNEAFDNVLQYRLLNPTAAAAQFFYVTTDPDSSGSRVGVVRTSKLLDFEDPNQRPGFNLSIEVFDGKFYATAPVFVKLIDQNDNPPEFRDFPRLHRLKENVAPGTEIVKAIAVDPDNNAQDTFQFYINKTTDPRRRFSIGLTDGMLRVEKPLDREQKDQYVLRIEAIDDAGNVGFTAVTIIVEDVNDNAPFLVPQNDVVVMENSAPGIKLATVFGRDPDSPENGPPFRFSGPKDPQMEALFKIRFDPNLDNNRGGFEIFSKATFDRERQKSYDVQILVQDNGQPQMSAVRYLSVVVGDENDNPMLSGSKTIHVYNYRGLLTRTAIGQVYFEDPDDWDVVHKTFEWESRSKPTFFDLEPQTGIVHIEDQVPDGSYNLRIKVFDGKRQETALGIVSVIVESLPEDAFLNSGSLRIQGITAAEFIRQSDSSSPGSSRLERLRTKLAEYLGLPVAGVQVFSIMTGSGSISSVSSASPPTIDVRFSANASPYRQATALNGVVELHIKEIEDFVGVDIIQVGINECLDELCVGGCTTRATVSGELATVVDANSTAFVGITVKTKAECSCARPSAPDRCTKYACKNAGICHNTGGTGFFCECRNPVLKGAQCEGKMRSFGGDGFAWLAPVAQCETFRVSLQFMTIDTGNSLLLYNGPLNYASSSLKNDDQQQDFLAVLLVSGRPVVKARFGGSRPSVVEFDPKATSTMLLNDGHWHQLDIAIRRQEIELNVDRCRNAKTTVAQFNAEVPKLSSCRVSQRLPPTSEFLTVTSPLQLGGLAYAAGTNYPRELVDRRGFAGCIRELRVNNELQELYNVALQNNSWLGCSSKSSNRDGQCESNDIDSGGNYCGFHGECLVSFASGVKPKCVCDPGWHGERCQRQNQAVTMNAKSFLKYHFDATDRRNNAADVKLLFSPAKGDGTVVRASDPKLTEFMSIQVEDWKVRYEYDMGSGQKSLGLPSMRMLPNQSYWIHLDRYNEYSSLSIDNLPGNYTTELLDVRNDFQIDLDSGKFFLGADSERLVEDFEGCISDFRWDDHYLPLLRQHQDRTPYAKITSDSNSLEYGCPQISNCSSRPKFCDDHFVCVDFWKGAFCTCPPGARPILTEQGTLDSCLFDASALTIGMTHGAVAAIFVCMSMLVVLVLLLVVYTRRRRPAIYIAQEYDVRDRIVNYLEEGGGEEDQPSYDISRLRKPVLPMEGDSPLRKPLYTGNGNANGNGHLLKPPLLPQPEHDSVADFIQERLLDADSDPSGPPFDELRQFGFEGEGLSSAGSVSSLASASGSDLLYFENNFNSSLSGWGPRFQSIVHILRDTNNGVPNNNSGPAPTVL